jgi:hypothetical protein
MNTHFEDKCWLVCSNGTENLFLVVEVEWIMQKKSSAIGAPDWSQSMAQFQTMACSTAISSAFTVLFAE